MTRQQQTRTARGRQDGARWVLTVPNGELTAERLAAELESVKAARLDAYHLEDHRSTAYYDGVLEALEAARAC